MPHAMLAVRARAVLESFEDGAAKMRALADTIAVHGRLPEDLRGNPTVA